MAEIDLNFIARQIERVLTEQANQRDALEVLTAMLLRLETLINTVVTELRAMQRMIGNLRF